MFMCLHAKHGQNVRTSIEPQFSLLSFLINPPPALLFFAETLLIWHAVNAIDRMSFFYIDELFFNQPFILFINGHWPFYQTSLPSHSFCRLKPEANVQTFPFVKGLQGHNSDLLVGHLLKDSDPGVLPPRRFFKSIRVQTQAANSVLGYRCF